MIYIALLLLGLTVVFVSYVGYAMWVACLARVRPHPDGRAVSAGRAPAGRDVS